MILPESTDDARAARLREAITPLSRDLAFLTHAKSAPLSTLDDSVPIDLIMAIYVDPHGVLRAMAPFTPTLPILPHPLNHWLSIRGRARARRADDSRRAADQRAASSRQTASFAIPRGTGETGEPAYQGREME